MKVKHLGHTAFETIMECFLLAFENYYVQMPTDYNYYRTRWKAAGVRFDMSYGMFDNDQLVGFIINAIDKREDQLTAYNSGTGVIPTYRGHRIVNTIYDYAIPDLIKKGIKKCQLEVITKNVRAIKSYESIGFKTCKHYKCFKGTLNAKSKVDFTLKRVNHKDINWDSASQQKLYSWDNQSESIIKGDYHYYQVLVQDIIQSYFIMNSENGYIAQFEVLEDIPLQWARLFSAIKSINNKIKINNIEERLSNKIKAVKFTGLENTVDQFEMELYL